MTNAFSKNYAAVSKLFLRFDGRLAACDGLPRLPEPFLSLQLADEAAWLVAFVA